MTTATKTRLGDLGTRHVWFTSVYYPSGCDLIAEDGDEGVSLPGDVAYPGDASAWWDLNGMVEDGRWTWDGIGSPLDFRANTVMRIVAYVPR